MILDAQANNSKYGGPSFSLKNRLFRALWSTTWLIFGVWTPVPLHAWRRLLVNAFGGNIHATARIYPGVSIWYPPNLTMGAYSCLGKDVICYCMDKITIADGAIVSQYTHLCAGTHSVDDAHFQLTTKPIVIGKDCWIAADAFVGPGVTVADGAVLGARGVTFKDLEGFGIYVGNPAKYVRRRATIL